MRTEFRAEKDRSSIYNELNNSRGAIDQLGREKVRPRPVVSVPIYRPFTLVAPLAWCDAVSVSPVM